MGGSNGQRQNPRAEILKHVLVSTSLLTMAHAVFGFSEPEFLHLSKGGYLTFREVRVPCISIARLDVAKRK